MRTEANGGKTTGREATAKMHKIRDF